MNKERASSEEARDLEGRYANYFKIGYNAFEFVLDFGQLYNGDERAQFHTRIITSPAYVKRVLELLQISIDDYEKSFGIISGKDAYESQGAN